MAPELVGYLIATMSIAGLHAVLPTHWLPFALTGRAQRWSRAKTVGIAAVAALGHVSMTTLLGFLTAWIGLGVYRVAARLGESMGGWLLIAFGVLYCALDLRHLGHRHSMDVDFSDAAAVFSFVLMLAISPCVALLPIFFAASPLGWGGAALIALVNVVVTVPLMAGMVWVASSGLERIRLASLQHHERVLVGIVIIVLGIGALLWKHH